MTVCVFYQRFSFTDSNRRSRRVSAQTDVSIPTESETEESDSETELSRTRSGGAKPDEPELKTYKRRVVKSTPTVSIICK